MNRSRQGYTLTEMLIVVVIVGLLTMFAIPKFSVVVQRNKLSAAREEITAAIATARAAAVQKGRSATFRIASGNRIAVTVVSADNSTTTTLVPARSLMTLYNVSISGATDSTITFDMRGFITPRLSSKGVIKLSQGARRDSICLTTAGQIMPKSCSL